MRSSRRSSRSGIRRTQSSSVPREIGGEMRMRCGEPMRRHAWLTQRCATAVDCGMGEALPHTCMEMLNARQRSQRCSGGKPAFCSTSGNVVKPVCLQAGVLLNLCAVRVHLAIHSAWRWCVGKPTFCSTSSNALKPFCQHRSVAKPVCSESL